MRRYEIGIECFDWDRHRLDVEEDDDGSWIKYEDYAKEKAQAISSYTELDEVRRYVAERIVYYTKKQDSSHYHNTVMELRQIAKYFV